jgi:hypothetical protein
MVVINMDEKKAVMLKYGFGLLLLILGIIFNAANLGKNEFFGYNSVGTYLIFCGFLIFFILILRSLKKNKKAADEREMFIASKANRLTFVFIVLVAFVIMIMDGIKQISVQYSVFMSYFVCAILMFYFLTYKILLKYN